MLLLAASLSDNLGKALRQKMAFEDQMVYAVSLRGPSYQRSCGTRGSSSLVPPIGTRGRAGMRQGAGREIPTMRHALHLASISAPSRPVVPHTRQGQPC